MSNTYKDNPGRGLSKMQVNIMLVLFEVYNYQVERYGKQHVWGIPWIPSNYLDMTDYKNASVSRALRRLEERGMILRDNDIHGTPDSNRPRTSVSQRPPTRTTGVHMTNLGVETTKRLTICTSSRC